MGKLAGMVLAGLLALAGPAGRAAAEPSEAELKAEFVERFTRFVEWSSDDLPEDDFTLCVVGDSDVTPYLKKIAKKRKLHNRTAVVAVLDSGDDVTECQVVVIAGSDKKKLRSILRRTDERPILTISDASGAGRMGSIINFYRDANHVKFEINTRAAKDAGLKVRSKLLRLAKVVRGGGS
jgi:hypothetical protein